MKVAPTGGPKDSAPAEIISVEPSSGTTSIKAKTIVFSFDDYVDRSVRNALTVLPNARFSSTYGGDVLEVTFEEPLDTNTTYTITLGTEWTDLRGNKPSQAFTMVFSTGDHIDSGSIVGSVYAASLTNVFLFCYQRADTLSASFTPRTIQPKYRLPVGSSGAFALRGLSNGLYRVIAVRDDNRNGLLDNIEDFVVAHTDVAVGDAIPTPVFLLLGKAIDRDPPLVARVRATTSSGVFVQFSEAVTPVRGWPMALSIADHAGNVVPIAALWMEKYPSDMLFVRLGKELDTSRYTLKLAPRSISDVQGVLSADSISTHGFRGVSVRDTTTFSIRSIIPADSARSVRIDTTLVISFSDAVDTSNVRMTIWHESPQGALQTSVTWQDPVTMVIRPLKQRLIKTWYQTSVTLDHVRSATGAKLKDSVVRHVMLTEERQYEPGTVKGIVVDTLGLAPSDEAIFLRFINSSKAIIASKRVERGVPFEQSQLPPGEYQLDVFVDSNNNGVYDNGDHTPFTPGELWWPSAITVTVRSRWTVEDLLVTFGK